MAPDIFMRRTGMSEKTLRIVQVTGAGREIAEPQWLSAAERVHRQLRPQLPADYPEKMRQVFRDGGEMCLVVRADRVVGVAQELVAHVPGHFQRGQTFRGGLVEKFGRIFEGVSECTDKSFRGLYRNKGPFTAYL